MSHIVILSSSIRRERKSHNVALYFHNYIKENNLSSSEILDLKEYNFPLFEDTIKTMQKPTAKVLDFAHKIKIADGIIIVTPEYNGGFPASLKNVIDQLYDEWYGKHISISTVSSGIFGGSQALVSLQFTLWKIGGWTVSNMFPVANVAKTFGPLGIPTDKTITDQLTSAFLKELLHCVNQNKKASDG